jgi:hypothetical protein
MSHIILELTKFSKTILTYYYRKQLVCRAYEVLDKIWKTLGSPG